MMWFLDVACGSGLLREKLGVLREKLGVAPPAMNTMLSPPFS